jgi:uncharacterized membrane protein YheB (UPF0754 family)
LVRTGRKIAIVVLPSLTIAAGILLNFFNRSYIDWVFKICLSGTVGIGTNYIAIKMLFRPYKRTPLGRQGLIPARRDDIAEAVASAVSKQLLDTDSVLQYMDENNLVQKTASGILEGAHLWIQQPNNRQTVISRVGRYLQNKGSQHAGHLFLKVAEAVKLHAAENMPPEKAWIHIRQVLEAEVEKPETMHLLTVVATNLVEENSSSIAVAVNQMLEDWINSRGFPVKQAMRLGKGVFRIDKDRIREELLKRVRSQSFFSDVMNLLEENTDSVFSLGDDPAVKQRFLEFFRLQKHRFDSWIKAEGVLLASEKLVSYLESDSFWSWLEDQLDTVVGRLEETLQRKVHSNEFKETARSFVQQYAHRLDVKEMVRKRINEFELQQLEELVTDVSGESLAGIELFGGILGMFAGLILIDQWFVVILPAAAGLFRLAEKLLSRSKAKPANLCGQ